MQRGGAGVRSGREGRRPRVLSGAPRRRWLLRYPPVFRRPSGPNRPSEEHRFRLAQGLGRPCKAAGWRRGPRRDRLSRTPAPAPAPAPVITLQSSSRVRASGRTLGRERTHLVLLRWDVPSRSVSGSKEARSARLGWGAARVGCGAGGVRRGAGGKWQRRAGRGWLIPRALPAVGAGAAAAAGDSHRTPTEPSPRSRGSGAVIISIFEVGKPKPGGRITCPGSCS